MTGYTDLKLKRISIHAPREGSDDRGDNMGAFTLAISIHAPREGSDFFCPNRLLWDHWISIHAPREGSDSDPLHLGAGEP